MPMFDPPYALWSIWKELSLLQRVFLLILGTVSTHSLFAAIRTLLRLRSIRRLPSGNTASIQQSMAELQHVCANARQIIGATFYLFGLVLFSGMQTLGNTLGDGATSAPRILGDLILHSAFATNVFFVFLVLHLVQWFVFRGLNSHSERLNAPRVA
jgi:hypothetical protein